MPEGAAPASARRAAKLRRGGEGKAGAARGRRSGRYAAAGLLVLAAAAILWLARETDSILLALFGAQLIVLAAALLFRRAVFASVLLLSFLFAVSAAEFFFSTERMLQSLTRYSGDYAERYFVPSDLGLAARPGVHRSIRSLRTGRVIYSVEYTIGADGFRVTPATAARSSRRINFLGDSYTFGEGLNDDETLPYFVAKLGGVAVKNYGFQGYGPHQALAILESGRDTSGAVNFFLTVPWHAPRSACVPAWTAGSPRYVLEGGAVRRAGVCRPPAAAAEAGFLARLLDRSMVVQVLDDVFNRGKTQDEQLDLHLALIGAMQEISLKRGQELVVGYMRTRAGWFSGTYSNDRFVDALKRKGIRVVDLTLGEALFDIDRRYYIHPLDMHPSAAANAARARLILDFLE